MSENKIEAFWRNATAGDVARVMRGEKVEARVRDKDNQHWKLSRLMGFYDTKPFPWLTVDGAFGQCQVYDPPEWFVNKPDPGEGYRLLEKFPDEDLQPGDEWFEPVHLERGWKVSHNLRQAETIWYRRRIEPVKQDAGTTCASTIPKGWTALLLDEPRLASDAYWSQGASEWCLIGDNRVQYANRDKWPAIRQRKFVLVQGESYSLPKGLTLEVFKEGFEVL